jgi:hypothetical protein
MSGPTNVYNIPLPPPPHDTICYICHVPMECHCDGGESDCDHPYQVCGTGCERDARDEVNGRMR